MNNDIKQEMGFDMDKYVNTSYGSGKRSEAVHESESGLPDKPARKAQTSKQRKASLQEYHDAFLTVPKITDRKTVFISSGIRERLVDIVRKLGAEKSSVSGFIENLVRDHLSEYKDDIESWKKL